MKHRRTSEQNEELLSLLQLSVELLREGESTSKKSAWLRVHPVCFLKMKELKLSCTQS